MTPPRPDPDRDDRHRLPPFRNAAERTAVTFGAAAMQFGWLSSRILASWDLTPAQYQVLRILAAHPEGLPRAGIVDRLLMPSPDATRLVDRLVRKNLVERRSSPSDRRVILHTLTRAGTRELERLQPRLDDLHSWLVERLGQDGAGTLTELCECILAAIHTNSPGEPECT